MIPAEELSAKSNWPTLLCIDDDMQICETIQIRLREYEVDVLCGYHGTHGLWLATVDRPDLVITDMRMPQGQGDYIVECLRNSSDTRNIPIIVLTGQRGPDLIRRIRRLDVQAVLTKPVLFEQLLAAITRYVPLTKRESSAEMEQISDATT